MTRRLTAKAAQVPRPKRQKPSGIRRGSRGRSTAERKWGLSTNSASAGATTPAASLATHTVCELWLVTAATTTAV